MTESSHPPLSVARQLGISSSTLRRWTRHFENFLSEESGTAGLRHYSDADLETLTEIKRLLDSGLTYEQVQDRLQSGKAETEAEADASPAAELANDGESAEAEVTGDLAAEERASLVGEIVGAEGTELAATDDGSQVIDLGRLMAETLSSLSDSQKMLLSGQQTERQLLGVLLQDNFNLKEENSRLRERMLEAERKLFELRRDMNEVQTTERERMRQMESSLFELQRRMDVLGGQRVSRQPAAGAPPAARPAPAPQPANPAAPTAAQPNPQPANSPAPEAPPASDSAAPKRAVWWRRLFGD